MKIFSCYFRTLKRYFMFWGRADRVEYWAFILINLAIMTAIGYIEKMWNLQNINLVFGVFIAIPTLTVTFRRFHDAGWSAWWITAPVLFLSMVAAIGAYLQYAEMNNFVQPVMMVGGFVLPFYFLFMTVLVLIIGKDKKDNKYGKMLD